MKPKELQSAVAALHDREYKCFRRWFLEEGSKGWDSQTEADAHPRKLDFLKAEAAETEETQTL